MHPPIATLQTLPFSLVEDDSVSIKMSEIITENFPDELSQGNGGVLLINPEPPSNVQKVLAMANSLAWSVGASNGGTAI